MISPQQPATRVQALSLMRQADEQLRGLLQNGDVLRNQVLETMAFLASAIIALDRQPGGATKPKRN